MTPATKKEWALCRVPGPQRFRGFGSDSARRDEPGRRMAKETPSHGILDALEAAPARRAAVTPRALSCAHRRAAA